MAAAAAVVLMLLITIFFYEEPERDTEGVTLGQKFRDIGIALSDLKLTSLLIILGILIFAVGEMAASPRIQEYITWIAPKEKAGMYMGMNFLSVMIGAALSGVTYTALYGRFEAAQHPEYVWYMLGAHTVLGILALQLFTRTAGGFQERDE